MNWVMDTIGEGIVFNETIVSSDGNDLTSGFGCHITRESVSQNLIAWTQMLIIYQNKNA